MIASCSIWQAGIAIFHSVPTRESMWLGNAGPISCACPGHPAARGRAWQRVRGSKRIDAVWSGLVFQLDGVVQ